MNDVQPNNTDAIAALDAELVRAERAFLKVGGTEAEWPAARAGIRAKLLEADTLHELAEERRLVAKITL